MYYNIRLEIIKKFENTIDEYEILIEDIKKDKIISKNRLLAELYYNEIQIVDDNQSKRRLCKKAIKLIDNPNYIREDCEDTFLLIKILKELIYIDIENNIFERDLLNKIIELQKEIKYCTNASYNTILLINTYIRISNNISENVELLKYIINICEENEDQGNFKINKVKAIEELLSLIEGDEKEVLLHKYKEYQDYIQVSNLVSEGLNVYLKGNIAESYEIFSLANNKGSIFGEELYSAKINMAYILRRKEYKDNQNNVMSLLDIKTAEDDEFRCINLALCYVQGIEAEINWNKALEIVENLSSINRALDWWSNFAVVGEKEGLQVHLLLYHSNLISVEELPILLSDFLKACFEKLELPQEIIDKYYSI